MFDQDGELYSETEAENEMYEDEEDSNAEDQPQNDYPDEDEDRDMDSEGEYSPDSSTEACSHDTNSGDESTDEEDVADEYGY